MIIEMLRRFFWERGLDVEVMQCDDEKYTYEIYFNGSQRVVRERVKINLQMPAKDLFEELENLAKARGGKLRTVMQVMKKGKKSKLYDLLINYEKTEQNIHYRGFEKNRILNAVKYWIEEI